MTDIALTKTDEPRPITVFYEGNRSVQIDSAYAQDHKVLKQFLTAQGIGSAANSKVKVRDNGDLELLKQAGPNGSELESILSKLEQSAVDMNPAIALAYSLHQRQMAGDLTITELSLLEEQIQSVVETAEAQRGCANKILGRVTQCRPQHSRSILV